METKMIPENVVDIIQLLVKNGIKVHVDGGWGVDALLGHWTRIHADLDIAIQHKDVPKLRELLGAQGYKEMPNDDSREYNFVLTDESSHKIDVHSYTFDAEGNNIFGIPYPADSLTGSGTINGYQVDCISPKWIVLFHTGYELDINDYRDVSAICERFGIEFPSEYNGFRERLV